MTVLRPLALGMLMVALVTSPALAQGSQQPAQPQPQEKKPEQEKPEKPEEPPKYEETVVVSGSRTEQQLINAPVTMSVITAEAIENAPTRNFAELLRSVPGLNLTQVSARDINVTTRGATGTLATGQLALLDGRSLYQDFFGFVMWDFLPVNLNEIKQVEVIRGPASAVWGANAFNGVINVITKSPREVAGTSVTFGLGTINRSSDDDDSLGNGSVVYFAGTHAQAINDRWAFKLSGGGYSQDALLRPSGVIPGSPGTTYPSYSNTGTTQPKIDGRLDADYDDGSKLSLSAGFAGTEGIMHTGIGPFDIDNGSRMGYGKVSYTRAGLRANFFTNILDGQATNTLTRDPNGVPIDFDFKTNTYDFELSNVSTVATRHVLSYGGNLRYNKFELSLAPEGDNRTEFGIYAQDEIFLSPMFRWVIGARVDRFDYHRRLRAVAAHHVHDQAARGPGDPLLLQPRLPFAVGHQQFPRRHARRAGQPGRVQPGLRRPDLSAADQIGRQSRSAGAVARRLRDRLHRIGGAPDDAVGSVLCQPVEERHLLHRGDQRTLHRDEPAARVAAAAFRHRAGARRQLPGALHLSELRQGRRSAASSSASTATPIATSTSSRTTPGRRSPSRTASTSAS